MVTNAQPEQDNGNVFNYHQMVDFDDEEEFNTFISEVRRRSMWDIDVDVQYGDKLLTLSTCCYDFRPEARCVVLARAIREGEDRNVDTSTAVQNVDAYFPQAYLDAMKEKAKYGKVKGIAIQGDDEYILEVGQTLQLSAVTTPADAPINTARWESSASAVATVDPASGFITALTPGEATITARADDGGYVDTVKVIVRAKNALEGLYFGSDYFTIGVGQEIKVTVYAEPEDAALELTWSGDSDCIDAYVNKSNQREVYITGLEATTEPVEITVSDKLTGLSASCYVSVVDSAAPNNPQGGTANNPQGGTQTPQPSTACKYCGVAAGQPHKKDCLYYEELAFVLEGNELTEINGNFTVGDVSKAPTVTGSSSYKWTSSDSKVVVVDQNGNITAVGAGTATITVTGVNGGTATIVVNVAGGTVKDRKSVV